MPALTPDSLPTAGRLFVIRLPDDPYWFALMVGALARLQQGWYWQERAGGLTVEETTQAWFDVLYGLRYDEGTPE